MRFTLVALILAATPLAVAAPSEQVAPFSRDGPGRRTHPVAAVEQGQTSPPLSEAEIARRVAPSVVQIRATDEVGNRRASEYTLGSGVVIDDGIVTNDHVVGDAERVEIVTADGRRGPATVNRRSALLDLVLMQPRFDLAPLELEAARAQQQGETVLAIGYPQPDTLGPRAEPALTRGLISAIRVDQEGLTYIETDAAVDPGVSGGALVNLRGHLIGLPVFGVEGRQGGNFAVGAEVIRHFLDTPAAAAGPGGPVYQGGPGDLLPTPADVGPTWTSVDDASPDRDQRRPAEDPNDAEREFVRGDPGAPTGDFAALMTAARVEADAERGHRLWERAVRRPPPGYMRLADPNVGAACRAFEFDAGANAEIHVLCREVNVLIVVALLGPRDVATYDAAAYYAGIITERVRDRST
jgi:S1-C subfamily serine protease